MKKLLSILMAIMMIAAVGAAWAADDTYTGSGNDNADNFSGLSANPQTIPLTKGIVFFNANGSNVYEPNVTYSYAVTPASINADGSNATVTDNASPAVTRNVYPGPTGGVTGTTIAFAANTTNGTHAAAATGTEVERSGNLSLVITEFDRPGIYRYLITETVTSPTTGTTDSENLQAAGMAARETGYDNTRYLDVYIRNKSDGTGLEMYGAVIFKTTQSSGNEGKDTITASTEKTTGFEPHVDGTTVTSYANDPTVDKYYTYNFTVKKTVSGTMADKNHEFPFYVTVSNSISGAMFTYTADSSETFTGATNTSGVVTLTAANFSIGSDVKTSNLTLKNNDTIALVGLPSNQTTELAVVIKEFNDTYDSYTPSASATNGTLTMTIGTAMTAQTGSDTTGSFAVKTNDAAAQILTIDNSLTEISPTGYVSRFAPFALILVAGIALLIVAKKRKPAKDDEE